MQLRARAQDAGAEAAAAEKDAEGENEADGAEKAPEKPDPYLLADAAYIQKETRWRNKQRTLIFQSRGVTAQFRHLAEDFKKLLPHHKSEPKFEKREKLHEINEICELKSCNNVIYFEARKHTDLYMWIARVPSGPSMKFQVLNIHTTGEVRLAGNCLLGSRPILYFDKAFSELSFLKLMKEMISQAFGTPRNHPKSKPFHDHALCFYWMDRKIWFRHYQVSPEGPDDLDDPERQSLTEIGPRFVLDPIRVFSGSFSGQTIYANPFYMSPTALRVHARQMLRSPYVQKLKTKKDRKDRIKENELPEDPLDSVFE
uniref:Brix domain-containing protein n=1 Tax=Alexandrium catenella TaxID=2925 RepID=A0A7S1MGW8_ALECA